MKGSTTRLFYRLTFLILIFAFPQLIQAQGKSAKESLTIGPWLVSSPIHFHTPAFSSQKNLAGKSYKYEDALKLNHIPIQDFKLLQIGFALPFENSSIKFSKSDKKLRTIEDNSLQYFATYIDANAFIKAELNVNTKMAFQVFLDGEMLKEFAKSGDKKTNELPLTLETGKHQLVLKVLSKEKGERLNAVLNVDSDIAKKKLLSFDLDSKERMNIDLLMNGERLKSVLCSPNGNYVLISYTEVSPPKGETKKWADLRQLSDNKLIQRFSSDEMAFQWKPNTDILSYQVKHSKKSEIICFDAKQMEYKTIAKDLTSVDGFQWSPKGDFILLIIGEQFKSRKDGVKLFEGMPDRWPWWRNRNFISKLDIVSGGILPITTGFLSTNLEDISPDGKRILFTQSVPDYQERPYSKQFLFELNLASFKLDTIWEKSFDAEVSYSPDGESLLALGGPSSFGKIGVNISGDKIPNEYDKQAYIYSLKEKTAQPITHDFNPSIIDAYWNKVDGAIYFLAEDRTYNSVYKYNQTTKHFEKLPLDQDIISGMSFAANGSSLVFKGNNISYPTVAGLYNLDSETYTIIDDPEKEIFDNVSFGPTEDWNFTNERGVQIEGRVYYPPSFDSNKKYPVIVYYYGGTSPTTRTFRGRYPKNFFAANGYIVYVLQPSGATGYGQEFSAMHVNNWGKTNAKDIIEGTKKFLDTHAFADPKKVGCIGASYGGFTTMYLTTQTDIFSAAISHAGISSISSYWGEGYWGYLYSTTATANSFPWNSPELYVKQSPLFNAENVETPLLLLHGNADTNVPPGESIQFYTALKLLGKDVTYIEIDGENHHIIDYKKRILWQKTILAYFDKYLKEQKQWWNTLYPERKL